MSNKLNKLKRSGIFEGYSEGPKAKAAWTGTRESMIEQEETDTEEAKEHTEQNKFLAAEQPESQCHLDKEVSMSIDLPRSLMIIPCAGAGLALTLAD